MTTTTSRAALTALTTGALALGLVLTGCTAGGDDSGDASGGSSAGSDGSGSGSGSGGSALEAEAPRSGTLTSFASCDEVGTALGGSIDGLELQEGGSTSASSVQCIWSTPGVEPQEGSAIIALASAQELDAAAIDEQVSQITASEGTESVDDGLASAVGGRAFVSTIDQADVPTTQASVITPHGLVIVGSTAAGEGDEPLSTDDTLALTYALLD
ncbi:hypothetical protein ASF82_11520 [Frigoribacterium sp. Leaf164]|uniref:hypothetical protein n=1 Tax=Frigoribacterium sp. Leaf164 TaxID=1736282 RepID=UPI0006F6433E|nr:hypothetical protein [Frigoribacterium sp. Leaf164]KQR44144.1 hypothetical protein ASF82_11520 [Frigoribacterium sp. Leaf164]